MTRLTNISEPPLGEAVPNWKPCPRPQTLLLAGRYCRLERLNPAQHATDLWHAQQLAPNGHDWAYLPYGPFESLTSYTTWLESVCSLEDPYFFAIIDLATEQALGVASLLRIDPNNGVIEVGHIYYSPLLQHTRMATEAMYLLMRYSFELGYRRYEWKCNDLNEPSKRAAERLGFSFEGIFRQAAVIKGFNRDTAWYSLLDKEWPLCQSAFEHWLNPTNFDAKGQQIKSLAQWRAMPT
ncbi:GNAT family N-acetyltransferase [Thiofilum flexile]|uniref:GNAT family N-acetyltransferase n=1 Tax=Thiofilum flexile TaxID=125627 RepID=UPI00035CBBF4|nr:GNAT family protein [Thiofilum flexile]